MNIWLWTSAIINVFLGAGFIGLGLSKKDKNYRIPYLLWGTAFFSLTLWYILTILGRNNFITLELVTYLNVPIFIIFLILMYFGTIFIFSKKIRFGLTYILLAPILLVPVILSLIPSNAVTAAALPGFLIIVPFNLILAILSWFLGLSSFPNLNKLFIWWLIGIGWILELIHTALVSTSPLMGTTVTTALFLLPSTLILVIAAGIITQVSFLILLILAVFFKEESF